MGFVAVLQPDTPDNLEVGLHLEGTDFNWAVSITYFMVTGESAAYETDYLYVLVCGLQLWL